MLELFARAPVHLFDTSTCLAHNLFGLKFPQSGIRTDAQGRAGVVEPHGHTCTVTQYLEKVGKATRPQKSMEMVEILL